MKYIAILGCVHIVRTSDAQSRYIHRLFKRTINHSVLLSIFIFKKMPSVQQQLVLSGLEAPATKVFKLDLA